MPIFDVLQLASFAGIEFPVDDIEIEGGIRDHVHEYPHSPGGSPEKLGRKLYVFRLSSPFHETFPRWPGLYPNKLKQLVAKWEAQTTDTLVVPTLGNVPAYCRNWRRLATAKQRSGEKVSLEFVEDQSEAFLISSLTSSADASLGQKFSALQAELALVQFQSPRTGNLFDALQNAFNSYLAVADQVQLVTQIVAAKLLAVTDLCSQCDTALAMLEPVNPATARLWQALRDAWDGAATQSNNLLGQQSPLLTFVLPTLMSIQSVSTRIYGDATHAIDIMQLNAIVDPFQIPAGSSLRYYPLAS